jgi:ABC-type glycerol-3-phosphate transport system permease component
MEEKKYEVVLKIFILQIGAIAMILPFVWLVSTALKSPPEVFTQNLSLIPEKFMWTNFVDIMDQAPFWLYMLNTIIVDFPGKDVMFLIFVIQIMLPLESIIIPNYLITKNLGLLNTRTGLILPFVASGFGTFMLRQTFKQIPNSLEDAALIDGAGHLRFIWHVLIPLSRPTIVTFSMISIATHWNDYFWPLIITDSDRVRTLTIGLGMFVQQESGSDWSLLMAATLFVCAPIIVLGN